MPLYNATMRRLATLAILLTVAATTTADAQRVPLRVVMEILGHSTIATTADTYGHVSPDLQRDATERTAKILFG